MSASSSSSPSLLPPPPGGSAARYVPREEQSADDLRWMGAALAMAQQAMDHAEVPVGCVFVCAGEVIGQARNRTNELMNATRHAELEAIDAILTRFPPQRADFGLHPTSSSSSSPSSNIFADTTLYVTIEPCIMCGAALRELGIGRVVFGAGNERFGGNGSVLALHDDPALVNSPPYRSEGGYYREEAIMLLRKFYMTENSNAPVPKTKARRVLKTNIQPPGVSMYNNQ
ncbi:hypothetical protein OC834_005341 [Tilletia horrida]|uniref:CMP/dCMP-type deaminase domain-containing protein n=1 Tax=Tilletia horrida TaxID=155126 RepID=A0AAN6GC79_9BASI|nr:hypothetical protein OC834_005341 [Tilletia horrida]KAK0529065.1 hypothetical protein OC842_004361 [Tilletia horrida]KAK0530774.1 hypothetical protein OC835_003895 [Tilletia horrida]